MQFQLTALDTQLPLTPLNIAATGAHS